MDKEQIQKLVAAANSTNATAREIGTKKLADMGLDKNGNPVNKESKAEKPKEKAEPKKSEDKEDSEPKAKKRAERKPKSEKKDKPEPKEKPTSKMTDDEYSAYCAELMAKAQERKAKAKAAAAKRADEPKKTPATKNKEVVRGAAERVEKNVEKRVEKGDVSVAEIEKIIAEYEEAIAKLRALLKQAKKTTKFAVGGSVNSNELAAALKDAHRIKDSHCRCNDKMAKGGLLKNKANYIPNRMITTLEVERNGRTIDIDPADILDGVYVKKRVKYADGGGIYSENADMVLNNNVQIMHHAEELKDAVKSSKHIPAWVVAKVYDATETLSDVTHYLDGENKMAKGGGVLSKYKIVFENDKGEKEYMHTEAYNRAEAMKVGKFLEKNENNQFSRGKFKAIEAIEVNKYAKGGGVGVTKQKCFAFWNNEIAKDKNAYWDNKSYELDTTLMSEDAQHHFGVATDMGQTDIEKDIEDWASEYLYDWEQKNKKYAKGGGVGELPKSLQRRIDSLEGRLNITKEKALEAYRLHIDKGYGGSGVGYELFNAKNQKESTTFGDLAIDLGRFYSDKKYADGGSVEDGDFGAEKAGERKSRKYSTVELKSGGEYTRRNANQYGKAKGGRTYTENRPDHSDKRRWI